MEHDRVYGVVVTYHPKPWMIGNLTAIAAQVDGLVVVDNGSTAEELLPLLQARQSLGFHLIENSENVGIFYVEQPVFVQIVGLAAQRPSDDLFA